MMEMMDLVAELYEASGFDCEHFCERCPFASQCAQHELFYGCQVWEDQQGEDL